jgi:integrase
MVRIPVDRGVHIYRRNGSLVWWLDLVRDGFRKQYSLRTTDKVKALSIAREKASALLRVMHHASLGDMRVVSAVGRFLLSRWRKNRSISTQRTLRVIFRKFVDWCDEHRIRSLDKLRTEHLEAFMEYRRVTDNLRNVSSNRDRSWVRVFCRWSLRRGYTTFDPSENLEAMPVETRVKPMPTPSEVEQVAQAAYSPIIHDLILWIANTAARISDVLAVATPDVDLNARIVKYRGSKTRSEYIIPLNEVAMNVAKRRILASGGGLLFATNNGTPLDRHNVRRAFAAAQEKAKVKPFGPHALRRVALTANAAVYTPSQLQQIGNHASPATAAMYYIGALLPVPVAVGR